MLEIELDGKKVSLAEGSMVMHAADAAGTYIPHFCYHKKLSIAANCRMCLVEVVGGPPKPAASCAMQVKDLRPGPEGQAPLVKTAGLLQALPRNFAYGLSALIDQKAAAEAA